MINRLKILFGCKGTWFWACRQMKQGKTVYRLRDSGAVRFTYDQGIRKIKAMIMWESSTEPHEWGISMEDVFATDFEVQKGIQFDDTNFWINKAIEAIK